MPGYGPPMSDRVIIGEAPGRDEVVRGRPFVGRAGRRLNKSLSAAGVDRLALYITNTVLCHPAGNETPPPRAVEACHERLIAEIRMRMPRKVLALGKTAGGALTGDTRSSLEELRSRRPAPGDLAPYSQLRVTYHPSALNRNAAWPGRFDQDIDWLRGP